MLNQHTQTNTFYPDIENAPLPDNTTRSFIITVFSRHPNFSILVYSFIPFTILEPSHWHFAIIESNKEEEWDVGEFDQPKKPAFKQVVLAINPAFFKWVSACSYFLTITWQMPKEH